MKEFKQAFKVLQEKLKNDNDLRYAWKMNIIASFERALINENVFFEKIRKGLARGADNFLNTMCEQEVKD